MRDIIWTVILVWLVWKIYDAFKGISKMQAQRANPQQNQNQYNHNHYQQNHRREGEVRVDSAQSTQKPHFKPGDGEYVDYEEVK